MPSLLKVLRFSLAAALITLVTGPVVPATALASPYAFPMPFRTADYNSHLPPMTHATRHSLMKRAYPSSVNLRSVPHEATKTKHNGNAAANKTGSHHMATHHSVPAWRFTRRASFGNMDVLLQDFTARNDAMSSNAGNFQNLASQSASSNDPNFQQDAVTQLTGFQTNMQAAVNVLSQMAADKGLANYDKNNDLETLLKNMVNLNKDVLGDATQMSYNIPVMGPVLGPIMYEIKCLIEDTMDAVENMADGMMNSLAPMLDDYLGLTTTTCASGVKLVGLCL